MDENVERNSGRAEEVCGPAYPPFPSDGGLPLLPLLVGANESRFRVPIFGQSP